MGLDMGLDIVLNGNRHRIITWRKANQIRGWFSELDGFVDNGGVELNGLDVLKLYNKVDLIVTARLSDGVDLSHTLPPTSGPLFGVNQIDQWYYWDLIATIIEFEKNIYEIINKRVTDLDEDDKFYYWESY